MFGGKYILGVITARGGSKGVKNKNIVEVGGKPLIAWTIEAALRSKHLTRTILSTDDKKIAETAKKYDCEVPFMRPAELARDNSSHIPVLQHAVLWVENNEGRQVDYIMLLQPTSPLRTHEDIDNAIEYALSRDADALDSVFEAPTHPYLSMKIDENGMLRDFIDKPSGYLSRQSFPKVYFENGAIYLLKRHVLMEMETFYPRKTLPYIMPPEKSYDIDSEWDVFLVDLILKNKVESTNL